MKKILVVGITPPPYGGQAMMTERLVKAEFENLQIYHVRMAFSKDMTSVGNFEFGKVLHMFSIVKKALFFRFKHNITTLYYMPGGSNFTPVARDIFILFFLRMFFSKAIFHFRAAGVSEVVNAQPFLFKRLAQWVYRSPDLAIHLSSLNPNDGRYFKAKNVAIVPNGLEDAAEPYLPINREEKECITILFVGVIQESKGVMTLLETARVLKRRGHRFRVLFLGEFASLLFKREVEAFCRENDLEGIVSFPGVKKGDEKWQYFINSDILCFPSFFESESFGNVVVEAMMFELPVVATRWRGIPDLVEEGETGYLVGIKDPDETADKLEKLIINRELRTSLGKAGRQRFLSTYQLKGFLDHLQNLFISI